MLLIPVDSIPLRHARHHLQSMLNDFMNGKADFVRVSLTDQDYKSVKVCAGCMRVAVRRSGLPLSVMIREGNVYLLKKGS